MKTFTEVEKTIAKNINKEYRWMARDQNGNLYIYEEKPKKRNDRWISYYYNYIFYFNHLFSAIKWEDEEPTRISDIYNPPILSDAEREYLKMVLKPFHENVAYVEKVHYYPMNGDTSSSLAFLFIKLHDGKLEFPNFDSRKMYLGMESNKKYKMDELGITYKGEDE